MNIGGWITMIISVGSVTTLFAWCIVKVLTVPSEDSNGDQDPKGN